MSTSHTDGAMLILFVLIQVFNSSAVMLPAKPKYLWSSTSRSHTAAWQDACKMNWVGYEWKQPRSVLRNDPKICLETRKRWKTGLGKSVSCIQFTFSTAHSHAAPSDSAGDELRSAPESFPICRRQTDRRDKRNKLGNASTSSNVACIRSLLFISKTVRLMDKVNLVYNKPCHFHLQLLFETFFVPINI
jgi:hypothetical protein